MECEYRASGGNLLILNVMNCRMRTIGVLGALLLFVEFVGAQTPDSSQVSAIDKNFWKTSLPRHELQWGVGCPLLEEFIIYGMGSDDFSGDFDRPHNWFEKEVYRGEKGTTLFNWSFSYLYRVCKFLWVGADVTYIGFYDVYYDKFTHQKAYINSDQLFTFMPKIRFSYLNRKYVTLYSGISCGIGWVIHSEKKEVNVVTNWAFQATAFGVKAGTSWFGFAEVGLGYKGFGVIGLGYHFNRQNRQLYKRNSL